MLREVSMGALMSPDAPKVKVYFARAVTFAFSDN